MGAMGENCPFKFADRNFRLYGGLVVNHRSNQYINDTASSVLACWQNRKRGTMLTPNPKIVWTALAVYAGGQWVVTLRIKKDSRNSHPAGQCVCYRQFYRNSYRQLAATDSRYAPPEMDRPAYA